MASTPRPERTYTLREAEVIVNHERCEKTGHRPKFDESPETRDQPRGTWFGAELSPSDWYCECGYIKYERTYPRGKVNTMRELLADPLGKHRGPNPAAANERYNAALADPPTD